MVEKAKPNAGHQALAQLEELGVVAGVITQNIDNLHSEAGSQRVVEFHGNASRLVCLACGYHQDSRAALPSHGPPRCPSCSTILKPDVVFFGEPIPEQALRNASQMVRDCEVMLVAGTSATVAPASSLPLVAKAAGAALLEVNLEQTGLSASADITLRGRAGEVLPALAHAVEKKLSGL